jgi:hypothetical protein
MAFTSSASKTLRPIIKLPPRYYKFRLFEFSLVKVMHGDSAVLNIPTKVKALAKTKGKETG